MFTENTKFIKQGQGSWAEKPKAPQVPACTPSWAAQADGRPRAPHTLRWGTAGPAAPEPPAAVSGLSHIAESRLGSGNGGGGQWQARTLCSSAGAGAGSSLVDAAGTAGDVSGPVRGPLSFQPDCPAYGCGRVCGHRGGGHADVRSVDTRRYSPRDSKIM